MENNLPQSKQWLKAIQKLMQEDTSLFLSLLYLLLIGIGLLFSYFYYGGFGLNIFEFADLSDFLLAPIAQPWVLFFSLFSLFLAYQVIRFTENLDMKYPQYSAWWNMGFKVGTPAYQRYWNVSAIMAFSSYLFVAAYFYGAFRSEAAFRFEARKIWIEPNSNGQQAPIREVYFLGKTSSWIFISEGKNKPVECIPVDGGLYRIYWTPTKSDKPSFLN